MHLLRRFVCAVATALFISGSAAMAQSNVRVYRAELAVPFGVAEGYVLLMDDSLIFVDSAQPEASFAIARDGISRVDREGDVVSVTTRNPLIGRGLDS